ncbi:hypothetical protein [Apilactobacillus micheneri]|uniref:hypothetical protein n=1 Tax=Apilactobacillus micheneri TaxID=1899430 RepID=UPI0015E86FE8|nr:hypothetical protein [Apilactobacillus micheneri]
MENNKQKEVANNINTVIKQLQSVNVEDSKETENTLLSSSAQLTSAPSIKHYNKRRF